MNRLAPASVASRPAAAAAEPRMTDDRSGIRRRGYVLAACAALLWSGGAVAADCTALLQVAVPGLAIEITSAQAMAAAPLPASPVAPALTEPLPAHCRVEGMIERRTGVDSKPYGIGFAIALPDDWNGRFLYQGGGGLNGTVQNPLGAVAAGERPALLRGFAVVSSDSGHQSRAVFDASFFADQEAALNFFYQSIGKVTTAAKAIIAARYGKAPERSYYAGCSTGGREGMIVTQRYPLLFDGVISGAPAMRTDYSNLGMRSVVTAFNRAAPRDAAGKPLANQAFSDADRQLVLGAILKQCDARDGLADNWLADPIGCDFDPGTLACSGAKSDSCLSQGQVDALRHAVAGPRDSRGQQVYPGFLYDTGIAATGGGAPGFLHAGQSPVGAPVTATEQDVDAEAAIAAASYNTLGNSTFTLLTSFSGHGGKLLFFHGVSDPWFSARDTVQYYDRLARDNGGAEAVQDFSRLFLVPGMGHCSGGAAALDQFDLLTALTDWVERGSAPGSVVATGRAFPGRGRPLCPYPQHAHYQSTGDADNATSFVCRK